MGRPKNEAKIVRDAAFEISKRGARITHVADILEKTLAKLGGIDRFCQIFADGIANATPGSITQLRFCDSFNRLATIVSRTVDAPERPEGLYSDEELERRTQQAISGAVSLAIEGTAAEMEDALENEQEAA